MARDCCVQVGEVRFSPFHGHGKGLGTGKQQGKDGGSTEQNQTFQLVYAGLMGSKPSSNQRRQSQVAAAGSINPTLPQEAVEKLVSCLKKLPLALERSTRNEVIRRVELKEITSPGLVIRKGQEPVGIYVLVSGNVEAVSKGQKFVLREIQDGDCFGEVSVLFGRRCTVDVRVSTRSVNAEAAKGKSS